MPKNTLQSNIWKYAVLLIANKRTFMSILGVYLLAVVPDATTQTIGLMLLLGNLAGFIFEIPSGYLADKIGHKNAIVISRICMLVSTVFYLIGGQTIFFILGSIFLSIGLAFLSGTGAAFMHSTLKALGRNADYSKIMGKVSSIGFAIPIPLIMAVPFLVEINFRAPFVAALIIDIIGLAAALLLIAPQRTKEEIKEVGLYNFNKVLKQGWNLGFLKYAVFTALLAGMITSASNFKDVYQQFLGVPVIYYGVFWGISRILVSLLLLTNGKIKEMFSFHQFLFTKLIVASLLLFTLALFPTPWVIVAAFILISAFNWSFKETQQHYYLEIIGQSNFVATLLSVKGLISLLVNALGAYLIGALIVDLGFTPTFLYVAIGSLGLLTLMFSYIIIKSRLEIKSTVT